MERRKELTGHPEPNHKVFDQLARSRTGRGRIKGNKRRSESTGVTG